MKRRLFSFILLGCLFFFAFQHRLAAADTLGSLAFQVQRNGTVLFNDNRHNVGYVQAEIFTKGWQYHNFTARAGKGAGGFTGQSNLGSGVTVDLKVSVEALPQGLRVHYVLVPQGTAEIQQVRVPVYLSYPEWQESPYRLGANEGKVPVHSPGGWGLIAQADGRPLFLGPSPALDGLGIQLDPGTAYLGLADNRQWTPNLLAFVTLREPSHETWIWKAGQEKHVDFEIAFNRGLAAAPTPTPVNNYGMDARNSIFIPANDPNIQYSGRFDFSNPLAPRFDWPAVSISAVFQGTAIGILLDDGNNDYDAFVDGKLRQVIVTDGSNQYTVGGLESGTHTLRLVKRTEASFGIAAFNGFLLEKGMSLLKPSPPPSRRIEFVGDSLACGAEDEDPNSSCEHSHFRRTEDAYPAFGPLAAGALGADYRITSYSGTGILEKFGTANIAMPAYYPRLLAGLEKPLIDPGRWVPDAVVVELGGNDFFSGGVPPSPGEFEAAYKKFVAVLRSDYPQTRLFCLTFGTTPPVGNLIRDVVAQENESGDTKVGLINVDYPAAHLTGCYKHFDLAGQKQVADELTNALREDMGWDEGESK